MGKDTTTDRDHAEQGDGDYRVKAADKKVAVKKAGKKKSKKKSASKKSKAAKAEAAVETPAASTAPASPAASAPQHEPAFVRSSDEEGASGPMRGIVTLWGPLAIIVLLIVVSRLGDDDPGELADRAAQGIASSLDRVESATRDVVEDVQDALTGGDPQAAAALGAGGRGSTERDLAAAFQDAGVTSPAAALPPAPPSGAGAEPWREAPQASAPAARPALPGDLPPQPENPWAPSGPRAAAPPGEGYPPAAGVPAPDLPAPGYGYQGGYAGEPPPAGAYPPPAQGYPPPPPGYGAESPPGYAGTAPSYSQQQAWGAPPPGYTAPPGYGLPPSYAYPPQPYAPPPAYPPGYYQ